MPFMNDDRSHGDPTAPESSVPGPARGGNPNGVDLLDINEIAAGLRVSKMTVYRFIRDGRLPAIRVGNSLRVHRGDLDAFLFAACLPALGHGSGGAGAGTATPPAGI